MYESDYPSAVALYYATRFSMLVTWASDPSVLWLFNNEWDQWEKLHSNLFMEGK